MIYSMPIPTNRPLPKASPRSCDTSLLKSLIRDRAACVAWSRAIESRCRAIQFRYQRGYWQSDRELRQMQRQATAVIRAAHVYRDLDRDVQALARRVFPEHD